MLRGNLNLVFLLFLFPTIDDDYDILSIDCFGLAFGRNNNGIKLIIIKNEKIYN